MYHSCIFCRTDLGSNESIEEFPVGRRLAFDSARGRLWVVCRTCERWNLSPLEERWEAVEKMEKLFRDTPLRVSTDQIGLARLAEGTELVRVGEPQRPEFAAWRYGDQFGRRRRRAYIRTGLGVAAVGAIFVGGSAAGISMAAFGGQVHLIARLTGDSPEKVVARLSPAKSLAVVPPKVEVRRKHLDKVTIREIDGSGAWRLSVPIKDVVHEYTGEDALTAARQLLPALNRFGGSRTHVSNAVSLLEQAREPLQTFRVAARTAGDGKLKNMPYPVRLALEMAAHEEQERRALEGELALLEKAWAEAEEVAAIADRLLVPESVTRAFNRLRDSFRS